MDTLEQNSLNFEFIGEYSERNDSQYIGRENFKFFDNKVVELNYKGNELSLTITNIDNEDYSTYCMYNYHPNGTEVVLDFNMDYVLIKASRCIVIVFDINTLKFSHIDLSRRIILGFIFDNHMYLKMDNYIGPIVKYNLDGSACEEYNIIRAQYYRMHLLSNDIIIANNGSGYAILKELNGTIIVDLTEQTYNLQVFGDNRIIYHTEDGQYYMNSFDKSNKRQLNFFSNIYGESIEHPEDIPFIYEIFHTNEDRFGITIWIQMHREVQGEPREFRRYYLSKCNGKSSRFQIAH